MLGLWWALCFWCGCIPPGYAWGNGLTFLSQVKEGERHALLTIHVVAVIVLTYLLWSCLRVTQVLHGAPCPSSSPIHSPIPCAPHSPTQSLSSSSSSASNPPEPPPLSPLHHLALYPPLGTRRCGHSRGPARVAQEVLFRCVGAEKATRVAFGGRLRCGHPTQGWWHQSAHCI